MLRFGPRPFGIHWLSYYVPGGRAVEHDGMAIAQWRIYLGELLCEITHIPGGGNCWGNLLGRWRTIDTYANGEVSRPVGYRKFAFCASLDADYALQSKRTTPSNQLWAPAAGGPVDEVTMSCRTVWYDAEGASLHAPVSQHPRSTTPRNV